MQDSVVAIHKWPLTRRSFCWYTVGMIVQITEEQFRKSEKYDSLLKTYQQLLVENANIKDQLLEKDKMIDCYYELWTTEKERL